MNSGEADIAAIGGKIRSAREERGLSLRELSKRSGLSIGFLSQVERGLSSIALLSLHSVADALGVGMGDLMPSSDAGPESEPEPYAHVHRADTQGTTTYTAGMRTYQLLSPRTRGLALEPLLVHIAPGDVVEEPYAHAGEEFAYVLSGELLMTVNGVQHRLRPGDSIHLRSSAPHSISNDGDEVCVVVSVVTPRLF